MSSIKIWEDRERDLYAVLYCLDRPSANKKTGDMVQLAVFGLQHKPTFYIKNKAQHMCGSCELVKQCYVNPVNLNHIYEKTAHLDVERIPKLHKPIRLGSWGDPGLLPKSLLHGLVYSAPGHTGYTHLWQEIDTKYSQYLMASIDHLSAHKANETLEQHKQMAQSLGYRTFTILRPGEQTEDIICPNTTHNKLCRECKLCDGNAYPFKTWRSISVPLHGPQNKIKSYLKAV